MAMFYGHNQQYVVTLQQVDKAKGIFCKRNDYELAEERLVSALDIFKKNEENHACLIGRHNLRFLYNSQNL
ncbi:hypothetical protein PDN41_05575 [Bacillus cereus]|nr:hypothetical protein [Bacillus cereus]